MRNVLDKLMRRRVEVRAGGLIYRGILLEVSSTEIVLRSDTGFVTVPMDRVTSVRDPKAPRDRPEETRFIDPSFYDAD